MLDENIKAQLSAYLDRLTEKVELRASLDESAKSQELSELLNEIAALSDKITLVRADDDARRPSFAIVRPGTDISVRFAAIPMGHEFNSLILALLQVGGVAPKLEPDLIEQIKGLDGDYQFEVYLSLSCQNCPDVIQALNAMSVLNPKIKPVSIDGALYQDEVEKRDVMAVPTVFLNGAPFGQGRMSAEEIVHKLDTGAADKKVAELSAKDPFEVLVVGGGPAGATAAIYAARKGLRTGIVADRFGGQVLDTVAIENFISVPHTEGPKLGAALEEHVKDYDVDIMYLQRAEKLIPAPVPGGLITVELASGATLKARSVIISTGASWRQMNVPGEHEYLTKGVTYCPHCDGPLFKGKRVAVIGGGNSGFEAAIDLAGLASHVTVLEFADSLRADAVLQDKLNSMGNTDVIMSAQTTEVLGDGKKVTGLAYKDRVSGKAKNLDIDGIFVQIGLVPNSAWLKDTVKLSPRGEIEIDAHGATNIPGVFAAGDVTTVPYKQIVIALGEGAKASLGAFDYLIRTKPAEEKQAAE